jgi:hypothetical protein
MHRKTLIALMGAMVIAVAAAGSALAASTGPAVHVQIRSLTKTLRQVVVRGETGWVTKGGTPRGKCPANSAAGALSAATHGRWSGKYYKSVGGIFITSILGVTPKGSDYWNLYVNGKSSSQGACAVKLHPGEKLLFKVVK